MRKDCDLYERTKMVQGRVQVTYVEVTGVRLPVEGLLGCLS